MTMYNIKKFEEIEISKELKEKLETIEKTIKPTMFYITHMLYITHKDMDFMSETLELNKLTNFEDLTNLRNTIVKHYQERITHEKENDYFGVKMQHYTKMTTSITHCIDIRISHLRLME